MILNLISGATGFILGKRSSAKTPTIVNALKVDYSPCHTDEKPKFDNENISTSRKLKVKDVLIPKVNKNSIDHTKSEQLGVIDGKSVVCSVVDGVIDICFEDGIPLTSTQLNTLNTVAINTTRLNAINAAKGKPTIREEYSLGMKVKVGATEVIVFYKVDYVSVMSICKIEYEEDL